MIATPRFTMADHDEMTGCSAWEPAPLVTRGEAQVAAEALAAGVSAMAATVQRFCADLQAAFAALSRVCAAGIPEGNGPADITDVAWRAAIADRQTRNTGPTMHVDPRRNR